jgi:hypothetical protein
MYTPNLPTPINTFCLAAVILLMWLRAYHTVKLLESGEFAPPTNLWKNDWVNLKIIWKEGVTNKVLSRKVLTKLITSPGAAYFSTKKNRNVCVLTYHPCLRNSFNTIRGHWTTVEKKSKLSKVFPEPPMVAFKQPNNLRNLLVRAEMSKPNTTIGKSHSCGDKRCKCCKHMQHSSSYTSKVTGKQYKIFCTVNCKSANVIYILECSVCGLQYVGESKQSFHNAWMDTGVTLQKKHFFLWASTPDCLTTVSRISTEWKSSSLNRTVCGVIFNVRIWKDFGLKNSVFYIRTVLTENNKFLCIFSFTVFIVNEYFTTVTKLRICAHHLLLTIILSILKCVTLYQVTIIPSYLYSEMRDLKIFNTSHFVTWLFSEL